MTHFGTWLKDERARISANDVDLRDLVSSPLHLTRYTRAYLSATQISLDDALECIPFMDAGEQDGREGWELGRDAFVGHLTEALFRFTHLLVAVGCSEKELTGRYQKFLAVDPGDNAPDAPTDAPDADPVANEECPDSDESGTLCADVPDDSDVAEK
jgi:hypothetical protein